MNKYSEIEIETAKNLLEHGYKWIVRYESGSLFAHTDKPIKVDNIWGSFGESVCVCKFVPIFQSVRFDDKEPTSLESIVHPQILDDTEKRYLSAVIKPFRDKVIYIRKYKGTHFGEDYERIEGRAEGDFMKEASFRFSLLAFKPGTMYKGMEANKRYTLKELGL